MTMNVSKIDRPPLQKGDKRGMKKSGMPREYYRTLFLKKTVRINHGDRICYVTTFGEVILTSLLSETFKISSSKLMKI